MESMKHLIDVTVIIPQRESNSTQTLKAHGHGEWRARRINEMLVSLEHIHSLIDHPSIILGVGIYATISNFLLGVAILCKFQEIL